MQRGSIWSQQRPRCASLAYHHQTRHSRILWNQLGACSRSFRSPHLCQERGGSRKRDYTFGALRNGVDLYQCFNDPDTGFNVRLLGFHPSEKTCDIKWSPAGELFAICEKDGIGSNTKSIWSTFLIVKSEQKAAEGLAHTKYEKFKGKIQKVI